MSCSGMMAYFSLGNWEKASFRGYHAVQSSSSIWLEGIFFVLFMKEMVGRWSGKWVFFIFAFFCFFLSRAV